MSPRSTGDARVPICGRSTARSCTRQHTTRSLSLEENTMMKFAGTEDHDQWVEKAQRLKPIFAERARALDERGGSPRENMDLLRDEGFFKLVIPREYGGLGTAASWCSYTANTVLEI